MEIRTMQPGDDATVLASAPLFDRQPRPEWVGRFLERDGHHLLIGFVDGESIGFITGVEITIPDKGTEMLLYELGVDAEHRRKGYGTALCAALADLARLQGCRGMWVPIEDGDDVAIATYRAAGAGAPVPAATLEWDFSG